MTQKDLTLFFAWCWFELLKRRAKNAKRMRDSYPENREKRQASNRAYAETHPEVVAAVKRRWYDRNREAVAEKSRRNYSDNAEKIKARIKQWRLNNPERRKEWRNRWKENPAWRIRQAMSIRLWHAVRKNTTKSAKTMELIGCPVPELRTHLQKQFLPGMTWENYGKWHIDHIRPCASFDLQDPEQQRACFNYTNLQPLWAKDNLSKGATYPS